MTDPVVIILSERFYATRSAASQIREHITSALGAVIDVTDTEAMTVSFADELFGKLAVREGQVLAVAGACEEVAGTIRLALSRRQAPDGAVTFRRENHG